MPLQLTHYFRALLLGTAVSMTPHWGKYRHLTHGIRCKYKICAVKYIASDLCSYNKIRSLLSRQ